MKIYGMDNLMKEKIIIDYFYKIREEFNKGKKEFSQDALLFGKGSKRGR